MWPIVNETAFLRLLIRVFNRSVHQTILLELIRADLKNSTKMEKHVSFLKKSMEDHSTLFICLLAFLALYFKRLYDCIITLMLRNRK